MLNKAKYILIAFAIYAVMLGLMFPIAGTIHLPFFWAVFAVQFAFAVVGTFVLPNDLLKERIKPGGTDEDKYGRPILSVLYVVYMCIAALDVGRFHFSDSVPQAVQVIGVIASGAGWTLFLWSMMTNHYFSSAIRLQQDRGQTVITTGPYHYIRHPGYASAALALVGQGLAFGSWLCLVPLIPFILYLIKRTFMEEKLLVGKLPGYEEYMQSVKFRWIPRIW
jgi:protein-S-isoprenylcysteine O-methyltransferase Ste14